MGLRLAEPSEQGGSWENRLRALVETMREMSRQTDPQEVVRLFSERMRKMLPADRSLSMSRRGLESPQVRITRSSLWPADVNPWKERQKLPVIEGGILAELIYGDEPRLIGDLNLAADDPAAYYLEGQRSVMAIPMYERGATLNMSLLMRTEPHAFDADAFPEIVWMGNLFGRATSNLVMADELKTAYEVVERELNVVADIQRSLLPSELPAIPTLDLAADYQTSRWAGGDYYDFFALPGGQWGILIADVSGHGTPAAVIMAITHSIAHSNPGEAEPPSRLLAYVNRRLVARYTTQSETFVTAFYGIYDPKTRLLTYACAGHNPPRLARATGSGSAASARQIVSLDEAGSPPLGLFPDVRYDEATRTLEAGDLLVLYTDGITEAANAAGQMFGLDRLDATLAHHHGDAASLVAAIQAGVAEFTGGLPPADDRTLIVARVR